MRKLHPSGAIKPSGWFWLWVATEQSCPVTKTLQSWRVTAKTKTTKNNRRRHGDMERCSTRSHQNATADPSTPSAAADSGRDDTSVGGLNPVNCASFHRRSFDSPLLSSGSLRMTPEKPSLKRRFLPIRYNPGRAFVGCPAWCTRNSPCQSRLYGDPLPFRCKQAPERPVLRLPQLSDIGQPDNRSVSVSLVGCCPCWW
jgi:hypothetical protein